MSVLRPFFLLLFVCSAVLAAADVRGTVTDGTGSSVPDAAVTLVTPDGQSIATANTARDGSFHLSTAATGSARLQIRHAGFKLFSADLRLTAHPKPVSAALEVADLQQQIDVGVSADADGVSTDPAANRDAAVVDDNLLERLPVFDQDYISAVSNFLDAGSIGNMGTTIVVDGMEQKNAGVTPSAVQSVKINNDPYSAEYSRPGRGRIEITTKTPDPTYHGTFNVIFRDYHLDARNAFAAQRAPEQRRIFEGALTGPVAGWKHTFFLLSADYQQDNIQSVVFAQLPGGLLQENVPSPTRSKDGAARVSHDWTDTHTSTLQLTYEGWSAKNELSSGSAQNAGQTSNGMGGGGGGNSSQTRAYGGYVLPEAARNDTALERHLTYSDRLVLSPNLLNLLQVMYERNRDFTGSVTQQPQLVVQNAFIGGGAQATQLGTENNIDIRDVATWTHNRHTVSAGFAMPNMSRRALDDGSNRLGTFNFSSLADYIAARPYSFSQQRGPDHFVYWMREIGGFVQDQMRVSSRLTVTAGLRWDWQNQLHDDDNFSPRASAAYAFGVKRNTVLRAGGGIFYDRTSGRPLVNLAEYSAPALRNILLLNPAFPNPFVDAVAPALEPANLYRFSPGIRTPYLGLYSVSLERKLFKAATLSATYRGLFGVSLFELLNVNQPLPPVYTQRPEPQIGVYQQLQSSGRQFGQALDISFSGKVSRYFTGIAQYTLSRTHNNTSGINYMPPNTYDVSGEYGRADFDQHHRLNMLVTSNPYKWVGLGIGVTAATGLPYTETLGLDIYNSGFANARPAGVRRNTLQGPGFFELDTRWSHDFFLSGKGEKGPLLTFAADAFNLINRVNESQYIGNLQSPFFGKAVSALPARRLQFTLRLKF